VVTAPPTWLKTIDKLGTVEAALGRVGFSDGETEKITSGNWLRVYRAVMG
jgi:membrane dipeptidase